MVKGYVQETNTEKNCLGQPLVSFAHFCKCRALRFLRIFPLRLYNQLDTSGNAQKAFKETFIFSI